MAKDQSTSKPSSTDKNTFNPPLLLETTFTLSKFGIIAVSVTTAGLSIYSGSNILTILIRSGVTMLSLGFLLWLVNWLVTRSLLEQVHSQLHRINQEAQHDNRSGWNA